MESYLANLSLLAWSPPGWGQVLFFGLLKTFQIALGAFLLGLTIGFFGALGKLYGSAPLKWFLEFYTTLIRAVPELVLILFLFYAASDLINQALDAAGYRPIDINGVVAGIGVLGFVMGAYATEVIRGGIQAIPPGQIEAGRAYGMSSAQIMRRIIVPAMIPLAIPGLANLWLIVVKDTALLAVVGSEELASITKQAAGQTRSYLMFYLAAAALYLALTLLSNVLIRRIEAYFRKGQVPEPSSGQALAPPQVAAGG